VSGRNRAVGAAGEAAAAAWYEARGYQLLARNWRCREGELDLVLAHRGTIVFCEVKARTSAAFGLPAEAVTRTKQQRIRLLATRWLEATGTRPSALRFDVACVLAGEITVLEACF
jgi:putative endonuclease